MKKIYLIIISLFVLIFLWVISPFGILDLFNKRKINLDKEATQEIKNEIKEKNITHPIERTTLFVYKKEQLAEVWITDKGNQNHLMFSDSILLENSQNGTRLYDNETVIPEGIYQIKTVNSDELSFTINFPNTFDIEKQKADKRPELSSTITCSTAKNDLQLSKELMTEFLFFANESTVENTQILILPNDFRTEKFAQNCLTCPFWIEELYGSLRVYVNAFPQKTQ
ncbi:MAG: hypothetical protein AB8G11_05505 [Saprospiraceae bacterium]